MRLDVFTTTYGSAAPPGFHRARQLMPHCSAAPPGFPRARQLMPHCSAAPPGFARARQLMPHCSAAHRLCLGSSVTATLLCCSTGLARARQLLPRTALLPHRALPWFVSYCYTRLSCPSELCQVLSVTATFGSAAIRALLGLVNYCHTAQQHHRALSGLVSYCHVRICYPTEHCQGSSVTASFGSAVPPSFVRVWQLQQLWDK